MQACAPPEASPPPFPPNTPTHRRRCVQAQVLRGRFMQLATSLATVGSKLVLKGALVLPNYPCLNSAKGWVGFGLPPEQGGGIDMVGGQAFITRPVACQPGAASCTGGLRNGPGRASGAGPSLDCLPLKAQRAPAFFCSHRCCRRGAGSQPLTLHTPRSAGPAAGAETAAYKLNGQAFSLFKPSSGFLADPASLKWVPCRMLPAPQCLHVTVPHCPAPCRPFKADPVAPTCLLCSCCKQAACVHHLAPIASTLRVHCARP